MFDSTTDISKKDRINRAADRINEKLGRIKIKNASFGTKKSWVMRREFKSPNYTTNWNDIPVIRA